MPPPFEIHAELEEGFGLTTGAPWRGLRVRYRTLGTTGRWTTLLVGYDVTPTLAELQGICAAHEANSMPAPGRST